MADVNPFANSKCLVLFALSNGIHFVDTKKGGEYTGSCFPHKTLLINLQHKISMGLQHKISMRFFGKTCSGDFNEVFSIESVSMLLIFKSVRES